MIRTTVGYTGGTTPNPDYRHIGDHSEAIRVEYAPDAISYQQLLDVFWASHEPTLESWNRQYRNAVFVLDAEQRRQAGASRAAVAGLVHRPVHTAVEPAGPFTPAEDYHQKYLLRRAGGLFAELRAGFADEAELLASTAATRINGYLGCNGSLSSLEREIDDFGLSASGREQLLAYVRSSCRQAAGPTCPGPQ